MKKIIAIVCMAAFLFAGVAGCAADTAEESAPTEREAAETVSAKEETPTQEKTQQEASPAAEEERLSNGAYSTPDSTIEAFIGAIVKGQDAMAAGEVLDVFAFTEYIDGYDEEKMEERLNVENPPPRPLLSERADQLTKNISAFFVGFWINLENDYLNAEQDVINDVSSYSGLKIKRIDTPKPNMFETSKEVFEEQSSVYGAQDVAFRTALLELDGKTYFCGFTLYLYGDNWKIAELNTGGILGMAPSLATIPVSEEEYLNMIADKEMTADKEW